MAKSTALREYRAKRDFEITSEPDGRAVKKATAKLSYLIQKHAASHLHYDFRLELNGVLLSWAVPKGPSLDPSVKRLAMPTEDHPLDYGTFEGTIPAGQYGGGTVMLWDRGFWEPEGDADAMMEKGRLTFHLQGKKLKGRWHLVRSHRDEKRPSWLLFKSNDEFADPAADIERDLPDSAKTGRTMEEIAGAKKANVWGSSHTKSKSTTRHKKSTAKKSSAAKTRTASR